MSDDPTLQRLARKLREPLKPYFAHLDEWYADGTYAPTYTGTGTAGTTTYTTQEGMWMRWGPLAFVAGRVVWTGATGTGDAQVGLPIAILSNADLYGAGSLDLNGVTFANSTPSLILQPGATAFLMRSPLTNAAPTNVQVEAAGTINFSCFYFCAEAFGTGISGGGGASSLTVKEVDGSPLVTGVGTLVVSNGTLTDDGGGQVTITTGGGGGSGTVTSVALTVPSDLSVAGSPITTSGTLAVTRNSQSANQVLAGPTSGGAATPAYRALVAADLASHDHTATGDGGILTNDEHDGYSSYAEISAPSTPGANKLRLYAKDKSGVSTLYYKDDAGGEHDLSAGGGGSVTSVGVSAPSEIGVSGSPVTGSGTIALTWGNQSANLVFAGPTSGGAAAPAFRALVAADIPSTIQEAIAQGRFKTASTTYLQIPGMIIISAGSRQMANGRIFYAPWWVTKTISIDQLSIDVSTSIASSKVRAGVYSADTDWQPVTRIVDTGEFDTSTGGKQSTSVSITLTPGRYLSCVISNSNPTLRSYKTALPFLLDTLGASPFIEYPYVDSTYGALPSTPVAWTTPNLAGGGGSPGVGSMVFARVSTP